MNEAAAISPAALLNQLRQLRAQVAASLEELRSNSRTLHDKTSECRVICDGAKRTFDVLATQFRNGRAAKPRTAGARADGRADGLLASLSPRQRQVLEQVIAGKPNKAIAFDLGLSEKTVESHRARVMQKLHAQSFADLVRISIRAGIGGDDR